MHIGILKCCKLLSSKLYLYGFFRILTIQIIVMSCFIQVSAYTLVAISVNRYIAIMWPLKQRTRKHQAKYIIALVWTMSIITSFPFLLATSLDQVIFIFK